MAVGGQRFENEMVESHVEIEHKDELPVVASDWIDGDRSRRAVDAGKEEDGRLVDGMHNRVLQSVS